MRGVEMSAKRFVVAGGLLELHYTYLDADAEQIGLLSKYVESYSRHALGFASSVTLPGAFELGHRIDLRRRVDGREYLVLDARVSRRFGAVQLYVEGWNLTNRRYQEVVGVDAPPRWLSGGILIRGQ